MTTNAACPICTRPDVPMWWRVLSSLPITMFVTLPLLFLALWLAPLLLALAIWSTVVILRWGYLLNDLATHGACHNSVLPLDDRW